MEIKVKTDDLVTVAQAAKSLSCARLTVYRWIRAGKIVGIEVAGTLFIAKTEVERLQAQQKKEKAATAPVTAFPLSRGQRGSHDKRR